MLANVINLKGIVVLFIMGKTIHLSDMSKYIFRTSNDIVVYREGVLYNQRDNSVITSVNIIETKENDIFHKLTLE